MLLLGLPVAMLPAVHAIENSLLLAGNATHKHDAHNHDNDEDESHEGDEEHESDGHAEGGHVHDEEEDKIRLTAAQIASAGIMDRKFNATFRSILGLGCSWKVRLARISDRFPGIGGCGTQF